MTDLLLQTGDAARSKGKAEGRAEGKAEEKQEESDRRKFTPSA